MHNWEIINSVLYTAKMVGKMLNASSQGNININI